MNDIEKKKLEDWLSNVIDFLGDSVSIDDLTTEDIRSIFKNGPPSAIIDYDIIDKK